MALYKVEAVVLRTREYGEADKIVTLYSREEGKLHGIAKGARRPRSRLAGGMQPFTHVRLMLWRGRNLDTVSQCEIVAAFGPLREDLTRLAHASYVVDLVDEVTRERDANQDLFLTLLGTLHLLAWDQRPVLATRMFEARLLVLSGFRPVLDQCAGCQGSLGADGRRWFSAAAGGLVCPNCRVRERHAIAVSGGTVAALGHLLTADLRRLGVLRPSTQIERELEAVLRAAWDYRIERPLRSLAFLAAVRETPPPAKVAKGPPAQGVRPEED